MIFLDYKKRRLKPPPSPLPLKIFSGPSIFCHNIMYKNVIDPGKSFSFVKKDIDIAGQNQYAMCTGPLCEPWLKETLASATVVYCIKLPRLCLGI